MSNPKILVDKIKGLMKEFGFAAELELMSFSIEDENNTILQAEKLEVGNKIMKINEEFNQVSLEDGTFKLKENFEIEVANGEIVAVKEIFIDAKLSDGTMVRVEGDVLGEGAKVIVITEQGEIPAPDGVHELEDGTKIETKDGIIARVEEVVAEEIEARMKDKPEKMEEVQVPVEVPAEIAPVASEVVDAIVEAIVPLMEEVKILVEEMKKMKEGMKVMEGEFNSFKKQPAAAPIKNGKTDFNKVSKTNDVLDARVSAILSQRNK